MTKSFGPTKYPRENILYPQNTHEKKFQTLEGTKARWHDDARLTRPMMVQDSWNLAHSVDICMKLVKVTKQNKNYRKTSNKLSQ